MSKEALKYSEDKPRLELVSPALVEASAEVLGWAAKNKYPEYDWAVGQRYSRVFAALLRHLWAWWRGESFDEESGFNHLAHAACCLMFLLHYSRDKEGRYNQWDDRPFYSNIQVARNPSGQEDSQT